MFHTITTYSIRDKKKLVTQISDKQPEKQMFYINQVKFNKSRILWRLLAVNSQGSQTSKEQ